MTEHTTTKTTWWIAHNNADVIHSGQCPEGNQINTGQPNLETFDNRIDWEKRLTELLPPDKYMEREQEIEKENELFSPEDKDLDGLIDHRLYTDSVEHLLYDNKGFRSISNPNRRN